MITIRTASGTTRQLPADLELGRVVGLDLAGRIVVDDFDAMSTPVPPVEEYTFRDAPFVFGLTLCCNASDKGGENGVYCRGCYGTEMNADTGEYLYRMADGTFPGLDPMVGFRAPFALFGDSLGETAADVDASVKWRRTTVSVRHDDPAVIRDLIRRNLREPVSL